MTGLSRDFSQNFHRFQERLGQGSDLVFRRFLVAEKEAAIIFIDGMVDTQALSQFIILPLLEAEKEQAETLASLGEMVIGAGSFKLNGDFEALINAVLSGMAVLLLEGEEQGAVLDIIRLNQRGISEPATDVVVRGPREGFVESLRSNLTLIRRKIRHPHLTFETMKIGRYSNTEICLVYIKSIVHPEVLEDVKKRLAPIDIDGILESGYIEELITDSPFSPYPTVGNTEKPDILAAKILEGRVGILVDGSPAALTVPMLFVEAFQSPEDYYNRFYHVSLIRLMRYFAFFISIFLPGLYIALAAYHQQLIPVRLLLNMAAAEEQTPFPIGVSMLLMMLAYEILREAGVRLPRPVGQALSIVGGIVMGEAAVSAGLISQPVLIVVAITVVASFIAPSFLGVGSVLRLVYLFAGWFLGLLGLLMAALATLLYLASIKSFGVPYLSPLLPYIGEQMKEVLVRFPLWQLEKRPRQLSPNQRRMAPNLRPDPAGEGGEAYD